MNTKKARVPRQKRSIETKERLMKTAYNLIALKGIHGTNSNEIAEKAGLSIGSFYAYFPDKKNLLMELIRDFNTKYFEVLTSNININSDDISEEGLDPRAFIKALIESALKAFDINPGFYRMVHALQFSDPDVAKISEEVRTNETNFISSILKTVKDDITVDDISAASKLIHSSVENMALYIKYLGTDLEEERLINGLTEMIYKYLYC